MSASCIADSGTRSVSIEQMFRDGWTPAEAAARVPDIKTWVAKGLLEVWGRIGTKAADPSLLPNLSNLEKGFPAEPDTSEPILINGQPVFDPRIFPVLYSPRAACHLNGLSLADVFRRYVVGDCEVRAMSGRIMEICPRNGLIFLDGRFPGTENKFHWRLNSTSAEIALGFVTSRLGLPRSEPSAVENEISRVLAARIWALVDRLACGHIVAVGTFAASGVEGAIGRGQWRRENNWLDVCNSDLCELEEGRHVARWTGVQLRSPVARPLQSKANAPEPAAEEPTNARKQIQTKDKSRRQFADWLYSTMADPTVLPRSNKELRAEAKLKWADLSGRQIDKCRADVLARLDENQRYQWARPGPKAKSRQF
jgi:hypothetical protein